MNREFVKATVVAAAVLAAPAASQLPVGAALPDLEIETSYNGAPDDWSGFEGKALVLKVSRTW